MTTRRTEPFDEDCVVNVPKPVEPSRSQGRKDRFDTMTRPSTADSRAKRPVIGKKSCMVEDEGRLCFERLWVLL